MHSCAHTIYQRFAPYRAFLFANIRLFLQIVAQNLDFFIILLLFFFVFDKNAAFLCRNLRFY